MLLLLLLFVVCCLLLLLLLLSHRRGASPEQEQEQEQGQEQEQEQEQELVFLFDSISSPDDDAMPTLPHGGRSVQRSSPEGRGEGGGLRPSDITVNLSVLSITIGATAFAGDRCCC